VYPHIALLISGGNTAIYLVESVGAKKLLGRTTDDAIGEAYDKISKFIGLGYPGGPLMDELAKKAKDKNIVFPKILSKKNEGYDFSYSGLKTAVINYIKNNPDADLAEVAYSFQESAVEILFRRLHKISLDTGITHMVVAGGVASNSRIREILYSFKDRYNIMIPPPVLCTDNAAMNAGLAYHYYLKREFASFDVDASPRDESFISISD
jgi:N6-L-threonylcarbamoyladenine synthase